MKPIHNTKPNTPELDAEKAKLGLNYNPGGNEELEWSSMEQKELWGGVSKELNLETIDKKELYSTAELKNKAEFKKALKDALNMDKIEFTQVIKKDNNFTHTYAIDVDYLVEHLDLDRSRFIGMIAETIKDPQEIRVVFLVSKINGMATIRHLFFSRFKDKKNEKWVTVIFDTKQARLVSYTTFIDDEKPKVDGKVIYKKKDGDCIPP